MYLNFNELSPNQCYATMTQSVLPRPIAWVLSDNGSSSGNTEHSDGSYNLAPFSYFNAVCSDPPLIMMSIGHKPGGDKKDTLVNIAERDHFVIHIPHSKQAAMVTETSRTLAHGISELDNTGLSLVDFDGFNLPRLADCRLAFACERYQIQEIGNGPQFLILGKVNKLYVDDRVYAQDHKGRLKLDAQAIDPLARLGSAEYGSLGNVFDIPRPE